MDDMIDAICQELKMQFHFLEREAINTVYIGGGTPSLMNEDQLKRLMRTIRYEHELSSNPEITLEANPDDLNPEKLDMLYSNGINRLSIGVQTFHDPHLKWMNRVHNAEEAQETFYESRKAGFENISLDLIYALPHDSHELWLADLKRIIRLHPEHISSYCLTIEPKTAFGKWVEQEKMPDVDEDYAAEQFEILLQVMEKHGYEQYEISNFAQPGYESQHNSNYWKQEKYLGVGPAAHSFNGKYKQANVANNAKYLKSIKEEMIPFEMMPMTREDQINEYILTSLRTKWGCDLELLKSKYDVDLLTSQEVYLRDLYNKAMLDIEDGFITLTNNGKLLADKIAADLFVYTEE
jgi:oxygen-independent coproporphyrinogen-3 oxidase